MSHKSWCHLVLQQTIYFSGGFSQARLEQSACPSAPARPVRPTRCVCLKSSVKSSQIHQAHWNPLYLLGWNAYSGFMAVVNLDSVEMMQIALHPQPPRCKMLKTSSRVAELNDVQWNANQYCRTEITRTCIADVLPSGNSWGPLRLNITSCVIRHHGEDAGQVKTCEMNTQGAKWCKQAETVFLLFPRLTESS